MSSLKFLTKTKYPRELRRVHLVKYNKDLQGDYLDVWVNWSRDMSDRSLKLVMRATEVAALPLGDERDKALVELNADLWAFQAEWWGIPVEDVEQIYRIDVSLYDWIVDQANTLRQKYRDERKKVNGASTDT